VETGRICGTWRPTVVDGELVWEFDSSVIDSDPWQRARDLYGDFRAEMNRRGDPYFRSPVTAGGRDWSNFEIDVMENVISNALHNRVPVQDWPAEQLTHIQRDFTALRAALPLFEAPDREYFALMERVWEATLVASRPSAM
jgi:hypothetical protein